MTAAQAHRCQYLVALVVVVGTALAAWWSAFDIFGVPKAVLVWAATGAIVVLWLSESALARTLDAPPWPWWLACGAFLLAVAFAATVGRWSPVVVFGEYSRWTGVVMYACYAVLGVAAARLFVTRRARTAFGTTFVGVAVVVSLYGLLQWAGTDPFPWSVLLRGDVAATLGNPNYLASFTAMAVPIALGVALGPHASTLRRVTGLAVSALLAVASVATGSLQGPVGTALALAIILVAWLWRRGGRTKYVGVPLVTVVGVLGGGLVAAGVAGLGPLALLADEVGIRLRRHYWQAALAMFRDRPVTGVGFARFGQEYRRYRSPDAAIDPALTMLHAPGEPHSVPLGMFASGGVLLGVAYLAVVGVVLWAVIRGVRRRTSAETWPVVGLFGAWAVYQAQSLISIDVPSLAVVHWLLAGVLVAWGFEVSSDDTPQRRRSKARGGGRHRRRKRSRREWAVAGVASIGFIAVMVLALRPLRADIAYADGHREIQREAYPAAHFEFAAARRLADWQSRYWYEEGRMLVDELREHDLAMPFFEAAHAREPAWLRPPLEAARASIELGRPDDARTWYSEALRIEPLHPALKVEAARFALDTGDDAWARELVAEGLDAFPDHAELLAVANLVSNAT